MNPSSLGWIQKFTTSFKKEHIKVPFLEAETFYSYLKRTGFIYGVSVQTILEFPENDLKLTKEENTKLNLFHALLFSFFSKNKEADYDEAIASITDFYQTIDRGKQNFLQKLSFGSSPSETLEKILASRLQESNKLLKTDAASLLTYALLYVDVLAYVHFLSGSSDLRTYLDSIEKTIIKYSILALDSKQEKNKYDDLVVDLVQNTSQFLNSATPEAIIHQMSPLEKQFLLDIACLAVWDDKNLDASEIAFLTHLNSDLDFTQENLERALAQLINFSDTNASKIVLFEYTHPVKQFYKQSTETVRLLILRNKNRLIKELNESGDLLLLLTQSTLRELTKDEKAKVKEQLFDIFKSIPSLAIFMLPGGAILLPLFVKLIPKLLPSAFNENRVDDK